MFQPPERPRTCRRPFARCPTPGVLEATRFMAGAVVSSAGEAMSSSVTCPSAASRWLRCAPPARVRGLIRPEGLQVCGTSSRTRGVWERAVRLVLEQRDDYPSSSKRSGRWGHSRGPSSGCAGRSIVGAGRGNGRCTSVGSLLHRGPKPSFLPMVVQRCRPAGRRCRIGSVRRPTGLPPCLRWKIFGRRRRAMALLRMDGCGAVRGDRAVVTCG